MTMLSLLTFFLVATLQDTSTSGKPIASVVTDAFRSTHQGFSSDEVILDDRLNEKFIEACRRVLPDTAAVEFNWTLMNLRKAGKLAQIKTAARNKQSTTDVCVLAEVVTRSMLDRHKISIDRIMADPKTRAQFNQQASEYDPHVDAYLVRKAAFQLRKTRRLQPELITRIADWDREISKIKISELKMDSQLAPEKPGIYIFHDESGYLYIGQSDNIRKRLVNHLDESSNLALGKYLDDSELHEIFVEIHAFPPDSRAREIMIRRAYESELIRSRKPRFNILP